MAAYATLDDIPAGVAGDITRQDQLVIEPARFTTPTAVTPGRAVSFKADGTIEYYTGASGSEVAGIVSRTYPAGSGHPAGTDIEAGRTVGIMRKGYCLVKCTNGDPKQGGAVHMYTAESGTHAVGDFSAAEVSSKTVELPALKWASSGLSADKLAEISIL